MPDNQEMHLQKQDARANYQPKFPPVRSQSHSQAIFPVPSYEVTPRTRFSSQPASSGPTCTISSREAEMRAKHNEKMLKQLKEKYETLGLKHKEAFESLEHQKSDLQNSLEIEHNEQLKIKAKLDERVKLFEPESSQGSFEQLLGDLEEVWNQVGQLAHVLVANIREDRRRIMTRYFKDKWPSAGTMIDKLCVRGILDDKSLCHLFAKLVSEKILYLVYESPLCSAEPDLSHHFQTLSDALALRYPDREKQLRRQICSLLEKSDMSGKQKEIAKQETESMILELKPFVFFNEDIAIQLQSIIEGAMKLEIHVHSQSIVGILNFDGLPSIERYFKLVTLNEQRANGHVQLVIVPPLIRKGESSCSVRGTAIYQ